MESEVRYEAYKSKRLSHPSPKSSTFRHVPRAPSHPPPPLSTHPSAPPTPPLIASPVHSPSPSVSIPIPPPPPPQHHTPALYRPGFQPKGVYRPLTDEFDVIRRQKRDGQGAGGMKKMERTKLERRLEKLIALHFPPPSTNDEKQKSGTGVGRRRPAVTNNDGRRASFFDFDLRTMSMSDVAGELWRDVVGAGESAGKGDIRAAEQRITPWQDDSAVSKCPLCVASFHPLTNRKHHCRLCGKIICSLPIKHPHRPATCSLLFVVDPKSRKIEEVGEGVDYGVRRRRVESLGTVSRGAEIKEVAEEEKFLKGVRICRDCRFVLLRKQYQHELIQVPMFAKLYEVFISLEKEIEDSLPAFQELILSLNHNDQPTKEASAARKRLLEAFTQYDNLANRIRRLPCANGQGSSQDRVQMAVASRASIFLQKHMFPLQSLPTPKLRGTKASGSQSAFNDKGPESSFIDADSKVAQALQPLLEQEALLESFVKEAQSQRKFEDVKTLKLNLAEIKAEIERILENENRSAKGKAKGDGRSSS